MSLPFSKIVAVLFVALACSITTVSCGQVPDQSPGQAENRSNSNVVAQNADRKDVRIAIPDIKGCSRDQVTFYKGKVLLFRRSTKSTEITVRTEWDTTEKLVQRNNDNSIEFRFQGRPLKDEGWKQIDRLLSAHPEKVRATVWVCNRADKEEIRIIDWEPPA